MTSVSPYLITSICLSLCCLPSLAAAETVAAENFVLRSPDGATIGQFTTSGEGTPALFFYDTRGTVRISAGIYETGEPGIVLNDASGRAAAIVRIAGGNESPVVVLKRNGEDKLIITENGITQPTAEIAAFSALFGGIIGGLSVGLLLRRKRPSATGTPSAKS